MHNILVMAVVLLLGALSHLGYAATMRCETGGVVSSGDTTADVRTTCGEPTQRETRDECRGLPPAGRPHADGRRPSQVTDCVTVETWTYNFGPQRLVHRLIFRNGRLVSIATQGYGQ